MQGAGLVNKYGIKKQIYPRRYASYVFTIFAEIIIK